VSEQARFWVTLNGRVLCVLFEVTQKGAIMARLSQRLADWHEWPKAVTAAGYDAERAADNLIKKYGGIREDYPQWTPGLEQELSEVVIADFPSRASDSG
jgi:hypothetical protein